MALIYHNITPPEYFVGVHRTLARQCFRGRRELHAYVDRCDLALGDSEFNRQDLEALGFPRTAVLPVVPGLLAPRSRRRTAFVADAVRRRLDQHRVRRPGDRQQEDRGSDPLLPRLPHDVQPAVAAADRRRVQPVRTLPGGAAIIWSTSSSLTHVHFIGHVSDEELVAYYEIADLFLCASEHEGFCVPLVEAFYKEVPVLAYAATAVPATMDGAGVLFDDKDPMHVAALMDAILSNRGARRTRSSTASSAAVERLRAKDFAGTLLRLRRTRFSPRRARRRRQRRLRLLAAVRRRRGARGTAARIARRSTRRCRRSRSIELITASSARSESESMIVNQWVPAAHRATPSATAPGGCAICCARMGHDVGALRADHRRRSRGRRAAVRRSGGATAAT